MLTNETPFKVTVQCRSPEAAEDAATRLKNFSRNVKDVIVQVIGSVVYMTFSAISSHSLTILGSVKDLLGMSYKASIAPAA